MSTRTPSPNVVPFLAGTLLWTGATALLLEDAWRSGQLSVTNAMMPALTLGTVLAAVFAHRGFSSWRPISGGLFLVLALLGSLATIHGTLGRQAEIRDHKQADALAENRTLSLAGPGKGSGQEGMLHNRSKVPAVAISGRCTDAGNVFPQGRVG